MNKNSIHKLLSFVLCIALIAAMALFATGCGNKQESPQASQPGETSATTAPTETAGHIEKEYLDEEPIVNGEGDTSFNFEVTDADGVTQQFIVLTDKTVVGDALLEVGLISGEPGPYGLYVKEVNGISAVYEEDNAYWAFYVNGEYATAGVDATEIDPTATYSFVKTPA